MERPVSAPGGVSARRNQILERPVLARRCRAHAPPRSITAVFIIFTGTLTNLNDPWPLITIILLTSFILDLRPTDNARGPHTKARSNPRK